MRVADERAEELGHRVGYQVRGERKIPVNGGSIIVSRLVHFTPATFFSVGWRQPLNPQHPNSQNLLHDMENSNHKLQFQTTGVLVEQLRENPDHILSQVTHLVIDEVHERNVQIDFLLVILKQTIKDRVERGLSVPRITLVSTQFPKSAYV